MHIFFRVQCKMHFLSILAIFKNEDHVMDEWLNHYINQGVDHFFMIDNGSTDNYKQIIEKYKNKITLFVDDEKGVQPKLYSKYISENLKTTEWLLVCDLDEFLWGVNKNVRSFLKSIKDEKIGQIQIPWERFGSSGYKKQPKSIIKSFLYRREYKNETSPMKSIGRSDAITNIYVHDFGLKDGYYTVDSNLNKKDPKEYFKLNESDIHKAVLRLSHYQVQSYDFFMNNKAKRGIVNTEVERTEQFFKDHDTNDIYDEGLFRKTMGIYYFIPVFIFIAFFTFFLNL